MTDTTPAGLDLDAIEGRLNKAAKGPWEQSSVYKSCVLFNETQESEWPEDRIRCGVSTGAEIIPRAHLWGDVRDDTAAFIAHARQDVEDLLTEVRRLRAAATGIPAIREAARRVKVARTAPEQLEAAQDLARLVNALDAPAPPHVAPEATQRGNHER